VAETARAPITTILFTDLVDSTTLGLQWSCLLTMEATCLPGMLYGNQRSHIEEFSRTKG
jgi:hypothetical protein